MRSPARMTKAIVAARALSSTSFTASRPLIVVGTTFMCVLSGWPPGASGVFAHCSAETPLTPLLHGLRRVGVVAEIGRLARCDPRPTEPVSLGQRDPVAEDLVLEGARRKRRRGRRAGRARARRRRGGHDSTG